MIVGAWPAPSAVLILALYASFWNVVALILEFGLALLNRSTLACRIASPGGPDRNPYVAGPLPAPPALPPPPPAPACVGPELPQAARAAPVRGTPTATLRKVRRAVGVGSPLLSVVGSRGLPRRPII